MFVLFIKIFAKILLNCDIRKGKIFKFGTCSRVKVEANWHQSKNHLSLVKRLLNSITTTEQNSVRILTKCTKTRTKRTAATAMAPISRVEIGHASPGKSNFRSGGRKWNETGAKLISTHGATHTVGRLTVSKVQKQIVYF